jgi:hypothetical protein
MKTVILLSAVLCGACSTSHIPKVPKTPTERKMLGLLQKFDLWDLDGNGELDEAELAAGLKGTSHNPKQVIDFYDTNGNGSISLKEAQDGFKRTDEVEIYIQN